MPAVTAICRYPVKGLSPQFLQNVTVAPGETLPFDRAWAIENGPSAFDSAAPAHLPKIAFLMLMRNESLAALRTVFDEDTTTLTVCDRSGARLAEGCLATAEGRLALQDFFTSYSAGELRGPPRIVSAEGHAFTDIPTRCLSLVNIETVRDLGHRLGVVIDPLRFRANLVVDGLPPWSELGWIGRTVRIGGAELEGFAKIERCAATNVDPQTGVRDLALPRSLLEEFGENACGIYLTVASGGAIGVGDEVIGPESDGSGPEHR